MSKQEKKALVPSLRFPEFRDASVWEEKNLGEVATFFKGKGLPKSAITPKGKNLCIHYGELFTQYSEVIRTVKSRTDLNEKCFLSIANDVLMPTSDVTPNGLAKACCIKLSDVILGGDTLVIRSSKKKVDGEFLARHIRHLEHKVLQLVSGSTVFHLYATSMDKLSLSFPKRQEQQKIADCLTSIDELITANTQKQDALKAHKKGLMQQLFPAEGEGILKLRFSEFDDDLKAVGFAELGQIKIGLTHKPEYIESGIPFLSSKNISNGYIDFEDIKYISEEKYSSMPESTKPKVGDILFTRVGSNLGNPIILEKEREFGIFVSLGIFRANKGVSNYYIKHWMDSEFFWEQVKKKVAGGAKNNLNTTWLKEFQLSIPSLEEQKKIADCLTSIDELITAQGQKIESLKAHKKGLMQQLFPDMEEGCV